MRTIVDLPQNQIDQLDRMRARSQQPRAALIREAIAEYLDKRAQADDPLPAFGVWEDRPVDGLEYQEQLRQEWDA